MPSLIQEIGEGLVHTGGHIVALGSAPGVDSRITEASDVRITEDGDTRVPE